jgi:hypothetical protein
MSDITPSLDHLVGACQQCLGNRHAKPIGGFEIDPKLEVRRLFDRDVGGLDAAQELDQLLGHYVSKDVDDSGAVGDEAPFLCLLRKWINGRKAQRRDAVHNKLAIGVEERR